MTMQTDDQKPETSGVSSKEGLGRWPMIATIGLCALWIGWALSSVHEVRPRNDTGEKYGWSLPMNMAAVVLPIATFAFLWGTTKRDEAP